MKTKICTDIKQSRKLIKLGLAPKTADMFWRDWRRETELITIPCVGCGNEKEDLPAWSLSALINLIPNPELSLSASYWWLTWGIGEKDCDGEFEDFDTEVGDTPIDAAYNTVIKLIDKGYIKTEKK